MSEYKLCQIVSLPKVVNKKYEQHYYIVSSEDTIKEGDICLCDEKNSIHDTPQYWIGQCKEIKNGWIMVKNGQGESPSFTKKVIASTDKSLELLLIDEEFVNKIKSEGLKNVEVLYDIEYYADSKPFKTKLSRDNYVEETGASHSCWTKIIGPTIFNNTIKMREKKIFTQKDLFKAYIFGRELSDLKKIPADEFQEWLRENF